MSSTPNPNWRNPVLVEIPLTTPQRDGIAVLGDLWNCSPELAASWMIGKGLMGAAAGPAADLAAIDPNGLLAEWQTRWAGAIAADTALGWNTPEDIFGDLDEDGL